MTSSIKIVQKKNWPTKQIVDAGSCWMLLVPPQGKLLRRFPYGDLIAKRASTLINPGKAHTAFVLDIPNARRTRIAVANIHAATTNFQALTLARQLVALQENFSKTRLHVAVWSARSHEIEQWINAITAALLSSLGQMPDYKRKPKNAAPAFRELLFHGISSPYSLHQTRAVAEGNNFARYLSALPANRLTVTDYVKIIMPWAKKEGLSCQFHDQRWLARKRAGAFLAVAKGASASQAGIVHVRYQPDEKKNRSARCVSLVGKGICFDTGGLSIKPSRFMYGMHEDMQGSAVVLGIMQALKRLKFSYPVSGWLALAENLIGPSAYRPGDVVTACDGQSIEVIDTDAEGRMVLADTLVLAAREKPMLLFDMATLTGSCIQSLGKGFSGIFSNREKLYPLLIEIGNNCGERVWPFPMPDDYTGALTSEVADTKQCAEGGEADHILAALFLKRFVPANVPWLHLDLASSSKKGGLAHIPTKTTGFGVNFAVALLNNQKFLQNL